MRRWHSEIPLLERRLRQDQRKHYSLFLRCGAQNPRLIECGCGKGTFRKRKVFACSCRHCRAESAWRKGKYSLPVRDRKMAEWPDCWAKADRRSLRICR